MKLHVPVNGGGATRRTRAILTCVKIRSLIYELMDIRRGSELRDCARYQTAVSAA